MMTVGISPIECQTRKITINSIINKKAREQIIEALQKNANSEKDPEESKVDNRKGDLQALSD